MSLPKNRTIAVMLCALAFGYAPASGQQANPFVSGGGVPDPAATPIRQQDVAPPDPGRGEVIATTGQQCGNGPSFQCSACFTCHGDQGQGSDAGDIPRLNGQSFLYLDRQLHAFAAGTRISPVMTEVARSLSDDAMRDVAAYYATLAAPAVAPGAEAPLPAPPDYQSLVRGSVLSNTGDMSRGIQACVNCHGPAGVGDPPVYPYLAGQYAGYLEGALEAWRHGARHSDPLGIMADIATRMTDQQVHDVARYLAAVTPVAPLPQGTLSLPVAAGTRPASEPPEDRP